MAPQDGATGVSTMASMAITVSRPLNPRTINNSTVMFVDPAGNTVPVTITYSAATNTVRLTPSTPLDASTTYTVKIQGGINGVLPGPAASWKFTTEAKPGNGPPPHVVAIHPGNGASNIKPSSKVIIVFDHEMDPATIDESTIQLNGPGIGPHNQVPYRVTYGEETQSVTIDSFGLLPGKTYTVVIKGGPRGVKDKKGNALGADKTTSLTVGQPQGQ